MTETNTPLISDGRSGVSSSVSAVRPSHEGIV